MGSEIQISLPIFLIYGNILVTPCAAILSIAGALAPWVLLSSNSSIGLFSVCVNSQCSSVTSTPLLAAAALLIIGFSEFAAFCACACFFTYDYPLSFRNVIVTLTRNFFFYKNLGPLFSFTPQYLVWHTLLYRFPTAAWAFANHPLVMPSA